MTALNLATVFGPTILRAREESLETAGNNDLVNGVTETMITQPDVIFSISSPNNNNNTNSNTPKGRTSLENQEVSPNSKYFAYLYP